jgi:putative oxidoreductase
LQNVATESPLNRADDADATASSTAPHGQRAGRLVRSARNPKGESDDRHHQRRLIMSEVSAFWSKWSPVLLSILRIVAAFCFMEHGAMKLFGFPGAGDHKVEIASLMGFAGILEFFGGGLVLLGLFTRPVAFILSGEMAFAYFMAHAPQGFWPLLNQGESAVLFCFVFLYLSAVGGGPWSLDRAMRKV